MSHRAPILIALCIPACVSSNEPGHPAGADPLPPALPALDTGASGLVAQWTVRPESVRDLGQAGRAFGRRGAADWRLHAGGFIAELDPAGARMAPVGAPDAAVQVALAEAGRGDRREALPQGSVSGVEGDDGVGLIEHDRGSLVEWWRGGDPRPGARLDPARGPRGRRPAVLRRGGHGRLGGRWRRQGLAGG